MKRLILHITDERGELLGSVTVSLSELRAARESLVGAANLVDSILEQCGLR